MTSCKAAMRAPLTALFLAGSMLVGASQAAPTDKLPSFNVMAACRALAAERDAIPDDMQARGIQHCVDDERTAREQLERNGRSSNLRIELYVSVGPRPAQSLRSIRS